MREGIGLYRGKRLDNGEWVEGNLLTAKDGAPDGDFAEILLKDKHGYCVAWHEVDMETIGQWTGLVDKNGVKVFEGDIVNLRTEQDLKYDFTPRLCVIEFDEHRRFVAVSRPYRLVYPLIDRNEWEVIGNIHDKAVEE